jgi:hypothetical protein
MHQNKQVIHCRHGVYIGSTRKGHQILGQQTSSEASASTILRLVRGHTQPGPESFPANPGKHAPTRTIYQEVTPTEAYTKHMNGAGDKGRPRDASRAGGLVSEVVQDLHPWLSDAYIRLNQEGKEGVPVRLHSYICGPLLVVPPRQRLLLPMGWQPRGGGWRGGR